MPKRCEFFMTCPEASRSFAAKCYSSKNKDLFCKLTPEEKAEQILPYQHLQGAV